MNIDASSVVSILSAAFALFSWRESRHMRHLTEIALQRESYEKVQTLPSVEAIGVVEVGTKMRAKLMLFNQRETPCKVNCVKCYRYNPKPRNFANWVRSKLGPFDWDYSLERSSWNPKGTLDDEEHYIEETLPFTLVKEKEVLLATLNNFSPYNRYRFEVITSQGLASWEGQLPNGMTSLPYEHLSTIN